MCGCMYVSHVYLIVSFFGKGGAARKFMLGSSVDVCIDRGYVFLLAVGGGGGPKPYRP